MSWASNRFGARRFEVSNSLEAAQGCVALQAVGNRCDALGAQKAVAQTAITEDTARERASLKASDRLWAKRFERLHSLEAAQSCVALEALCKRCAALGTHPVCAKTVTRGTTSSWVQKVSQKMQNIVMGC